MLPSLFQIHLSILQTQKESGLGLFGMMERMSTMGGELKINTTPGQGTEVVAKYTYRENDGG